MTRVFLGGTCNGSTWRDYVIEHMPEDVKFFNPVVDVWDEKARDKEELEKWGFCNLHLYVITPRMKGVYSIAEIVESSMRKNIDVLMCVLPKDGDLEFDEEQMKSFDAVATMIKKYSAYSCNSLEDVIRYINALKQ